LAIDLLSPEPRLPATTKAWGTFLPVWVSFPFWTRLLAERSTSLGEAVHEWLRESSEERLWPLFEKALQDERLLLLVDGIDEYTNESAGQTAKSLLEVFVSQRDCPVVATSRPAGLERLGDLPANWRSAQLAELAPKQQIAIAESWYGHRILHQSSGDLTPNDSALAARLAQTFVDDLRKSSDLMDLAKTPLLFCLLLYFKHSNIPLPPNRFLAYRGLVDHLLATHPKQRRAAALVTVDPDWSDGEMRKVMAALALEMQTNCPQGVISTDGAESAVEVFLQDTDRGFGLSLAVARGATGQALEERGCISASFLSGVPVCSGPVSPAIC
jgi:predicted NACHT family NTPase